jgi:hypothetical protein
MSTFLLRPLLAALACCLLWGCWGEENPGGSEVENEVTVGRLYLADGKPAAHARIRIYPVNNLPQPGALQKKADLVYSTFTDAKGRYTIDSIPAGEYNIFGDRDGDRSLRDSVYLSSSPQNLPPDTLDEPGSIAGVVALQPNHDLRTVTLQLLGTNEYTNADGEGRFTFDNLAEGRYRLRVTTTEENYTPLFLGVTVRSGRTDTLADTLRPVFTGIPVVTGLHVAYDTVAGVAVLSWRPAEYKHFSRFHIYRDRAGSLSPSAFPIGSTRDTVYFDSLYRDGEPIAGLGPDSPPRVEYRVRVVNLSDVPGLPFGSVAVDAVDPDRASTSLSLRLASGGMEASLGDTLFLVARYGNPTRNLKELRWYSLPGGTPLRTAPLEGRSGTDTLRFVAPMEAGQVSFRLEATDEAGSTWASHQAISILRDPPQAFAGSDTSVWYKGSRVELRGAGQDRFGKVVKREWDIGAQGIFRIAPTGDTAFTLDSIPRQGVTCVLRVTDDDGQTATDTLVIRPIVSRIISSMPSPGYDMSALAHEGRILLFGGVLGDTITREVTEYDPAAGTWTSKAPMPTPRRGTGAAVYEGKIHVIAGREPDIPGVTRWAWTWGIYDPASNTWLQIAPQARLGYSAIMESAGTLYAVGNAEVMAFSQTQQEWRMHSQVRWSTDWTGFAVVQGTILTFNYERRAFGEASKVWVGIFEPGQYLPRAKGNFGVPGWGEEQTPLRNVAVIGTKVYLLHKGILVSYESVHDVDRKEPAPLLDRSDVTMVALNGKLYFIGGVDPKTGKLDPRVEEYIPLD